MAHWSQVKEKAGSLWQIRFVFSLYRMLGFKRISFILHPLVLGFLLFSPGSRRVSKEFLQRRAGILGIGKVKFADIYQHFYSFAYLLIEKLAAWAGDFHDSDLVYESPDIDLLVEQLGDGKGAVILCSHMGNIELLRALAVTDSPKRVQDLTINSIVDFAGTSKFNKVLEEINPSSMVRLISARDMGADTIIHLKDCLNRGELVIIAGDRTSAKNPGKTCPVEFLGQAAWFPQGAFVLASLMEAPIYHMYAVREFDHDFSSNYHFIVHKAQVDFTGSRRERMSKIKDLVQEYAQHLEKLCLQHPYQWYNFFDFWKNPNPQSGE